MWIKYKVDNKNYRYLPVKENKVFIFFIGFCVNRKKIQHVDEVVKNIYSIDQFLTDQTFLIWDQTKGFYLFI
jgi:hypothetical protein